MQMRNQYLIALCLSVLTNASWSQQLGIENQNNQAVDAYWTPERLQNAKPMPMPTPKEPYPTKDRGLPLPSSFEIDPIHPTKGDKNLAPMKNTQRPLTKITKLDYGTFNLQFSSSRIVPLSADQSYPYSAIGRLFFTIPNQGDFTCSASVISPRIILTAGHCVHSGTSSGYFTNWKFIPAYRDKKAPFDSWNWKYTITTSTWISGGGIVPNGADYALIEVEDKSINGTTKKIVDVTGSLGVKTQALASNHVHLIGYPCNLDNCEKMHQVTAQNGRGVSPNNIEYGSDMLGGSSGGPWVQNFGTAAQGQTGGLNSGMNLVVGITSYGYTTTAPMVQGSSVPDSRFTEIYQNACAHKEGNC